MFRHGDNGLVDGAGPFLRTGDLGFLDDGELYITGRIKDPIIIRGRNHYPQDIELTVEQSHPALQPGAGAAFSVEVNGEERLVIAHELKREQRHANVDEVVRAIREAVSAQHELQVYAVQLLKPATIPRTSSGKLQRYQKREAFESALSRAVIQSLARHAAIAIERDGDPEPALRQSLRMLQAGQPLVIYPEGTRTLTGALGEFQLGAAWLALATHAPLVPVRIDGSFEIFKAGQHIPRVFDWQQRTRPRVRVTFAKPLSPPADAKGRAAELTLTQRLRAAIEQP